MALKLAILFLISLGSLHAEIGPPKVAPALQRHGDTTNEPITMVWDANPASEQVAFYNIYRTKVATTGGKKLTWELIGTTVLTTFTAPRISGVNAFMVKAVNAFREGPGAVLMVPATLP